MFKMDATAESEDGATPWIVCREDVFHEKPDRLGEEVENRGQFRNGYYDSGTGSFSRIGHDARIIGLRGTFGFQGERKPKTRARESCCVDGGGS
ncbi:MAG: hypothetical protein RLZ37_455 [Actinomycetota bacterium]|jgi:hypothetical protein